MLGAPFAAKSGAISVNGTCEVGSCSSVDSLANGESASSDFTLSYTFGDGDSYNISGSYSASYSTVGGSTISVDPIITYSGAAPSVATDVINFTLLQDYFDTSLGSWAGTYTESLPLELETSAGPSSTVSGQLFYDGEGVGPVGPFGPGSYFVTESANLDFGSLDPSDTLAASYDLSFQFGAGTLPGASADSVSTPEPALTIPCGVGLILLMYGRRRRTRSRNSTQQLEFTVLDDIR